VASGLLLALPFLVEPTGPLVLVGLAAWALMVDPRLFRRWLWASCYGSAFLYVFLGLLWLDKVHLVVPPVLALYFGFYPVLSAWVYRRLVRFGAPAWLGVPLVWVSHEYLLRVASLFPSGYLNMGYALLPLGPVAQTADLWGVGGLTFLAGLAGGLLAEVLVPLLAPGAEKGRLRLPGAALLVLLAAGSVAYGLWRVHALPQGGEVDLLLVQGNVARAVKEDPRRELDVLLRHIELTSEAAAPSPDLVLWPEASACMFPDPLKETIWQGVLSRLAEEIDAPLLVGAAGFALDEHGERRITNSAYLIQPGSGSVGRYDKVALVPWGEYIPIVHLLPPRLQAWARRGLRSFIGVYPYVLPGPGPEPMLVETAGRSFRVGILICYEDTRPAYTAALVRRGADLLVNPSNEAWYHPNEMDQHLTIARMRAIENRRSMVRPTNTGITAVIDPAGRVTHRLLVDGRDRDVEGVLRARVPLCTARSLYTRTGPLFARVCLGITLLALVAAVVLERRRAKSETAEDPGEEE